MFDVSRLSPPLAEVAQTAWHHALESIAPELRARLEAWADESEDSAELANVFALSEYAASVVRSQPAAFAAFLASRGYRDPPPDEFVDSSFESITEVDALKKRLRQLRNAAMLHVIWRDLNGRAALAETTGALTRLRDQLTAQVRA